MQTLEIICPVYNEGAALERFVENLYQELSVLSAEFNFKILFVHDPSKRDETWSVIKSLAARDSRISGISMFKRFGIQAAIWAGLKHSQGDIVITMDADGQHPAKIIPELIKEYKNSHKVVLTKRKESPRLSIFIFYKLLSAFSKHPPADSHSDFRLLDREVVNTLVNNFDERQPFLRALLGYWGDVSVIDIEINERMSGVSSFNLRRSYDYLIGIIQASGHFPYKYLCPIVSIFPIGFSIYELILQNWYLSMIWFWIFIVSVFLGMMAFNLEGILNHTRKRPAYIVREKINL